jgi:hypothetical protein
MMDELPEVLNAPGKDKNNKMRLLVHRGRLVLLILLALICGKLPAQILDDTTQAVYGPATTQYTTFEQIKFDLNHYFPLDTTIDNLHKFGAVDEHNYFLQDLGFLGSAVNPIFFTPPALIGRTTGFPVYDIYFKNPGQFKYYDTKSPYSNVHAIFAGNNRNIVDVTYTRNVNPTWNIGFNFRRTSADRQLDRISQNNRQTLSTYYDIYTHYQTPNKRYSLLANAARLNHEVAELGGIDTTSGPGFAIGNDAFFLYQDANVMLQDARTREFRFNVALYHQYQLLSKNIQLYHDMVINTEKNAYQDNSVASNRNFYDKVLINNDTTDEQFRYGEFRNEVGFKGEVSNLFYMFFAKRRSINFDQKYLIPDSRNHEHSGGAYLRWKFDSLHYLQVNGELMMGGEHLLQGTYQNRFFEGSYKRIMSRPAYIHQAYYGNHNSWTRNFRSPQSDNIYAAINFEWPVLKIKPFFNFSSVFNHIYFNERVEPAQISGFAQIFSPGISFKWQPFNNIYWENTAIYTKVTGSSRSVFRFPDLFVNSDLYFKNHLFASKMLLKLGIGAHYKSPYLAPAYHPTIQNFYLQNNFWIPKGNQAQHYVVLNAYANVHMGNIRFFFRMEHFNQGQDNGYFTTPYFTGQPQTLNFGVNWMFFD